jgi:hypothetical protein
MLMKTRPWENTVRFFSNLEAHNEFFGPMRRLVEHIASQPYAALLFSTTSMHALLVAQHAEIESGHDVLRVERDLSGRTVRFTYQEQEFVKPATWECDTEKVVETFEGFLRTVKWVSIGAIAGDP